MRKIKNFKINIRPREVSRLLRKLLNMEELPIEIEESVQRACFFYNKAIMPAVVYDTYSKESMICNFEINPPEKWIAISPYIITIGGKLQEEFNKEPEKFGTYSLQIVSAIAGDTLEQAKNFVQKLINSEAEDEYCELSRNVEVPNNIYENIVNLLPTDKISVSLIKQESDNSFKFEPSNTSIGIYYWIPKKKRTKK